MSKKTLGYLGEQIAKQYLLEHAFQFIEKNFNAIYGEIDLIVKKDNVYHFVEVKTRSIIDWEKYDFTEILSKSKKDRLRRAINIYKKEKNLNDIFYQLDLLIVFLDKYKKVQKILFYPNFSLEI